MTEPILWQHFEAATLRRAADADRPVLMVLVAPWCQHCRDLLQTSFTDPQVVHLVHENFVPVLVDAERRPDVNQRYGTGAWPTIASSRVLVTRKLAGTIIGLPATAAVSAFRS